MKKLTIALAALLMTAAAYGQGTVTINNLLNSNRFYLSGTDAVDASGKPTASSIGTQFTINLLGGPAGGPASGLVPLVPSTTTFRGAAGTAAAGYITPTTATVPNVAPGGNADIVIRLMGPGLAATGQDFKFTANGLGGDNPNGPPFTPPNLSFGTGAIAVVAVPEPATLALGVIGLGSVLFLRRRK